jgi:hypothetical protein
MYIFETIIEWITELIEELRKSKILLTPFIILFYLIIILLFTATINVSKGIVENNNFSKNLHNNIKNNICDKEW